MKRGVKQKYDFEIYKLVDFKKQFIEKCCRDRLKDFGFTSNRINNACNEKKTNEVRVYGDYVVKRVPKESYDNQRRNQCN